MCTFVTSSRGFTDLCEIWSGASLYSGETYVLLFILVKQKVFEAHPVQHQGAAASDFFLKEYRTIQSRWNFLFKGLRRGKL